MSEAWERQDAQHQPEDRGARCRACGQPWPCGTRLNLDAIREARRRIEEAAS